jgi:hypothetical protein
MNGGLGEILFERFSGYPGFEMFVVCTIVTLLAEAAT